MSLHVPARRAAVEPAWLRDSLYRKAQRLPSLDLPFAERRSLVDAVTGRSLVTFTRASSGSFIDSSGTLQTAATDVPRFGHNPVTGESLGLLVEESRTNLLVRSEEFDNASWAPVSVAVTANQIASPSGSTTADLIAGSAGTTTKYIYGLYSTAASGTYTFSVFAKAGTESLIVVRAVDQTGANDVRQRFDLSSGTLNGSAAAGGTATSASASIAAFGNGWYRCTVTGTFAAFTQLQGNVFLNVYGSTSLTTNFYAWGAQLEVGAFPTSYIPTTTAAATRAADVASITGTNFSSWYRQDEGTLCGDAQRESAVPGTDFPVIVDGRISSTDIVQVGYVTESLSVGYVKAGNVDQATMYNTGMSGVRRRQVACGMAANNFAVATNGGSIVSASSGTMPTNIASIFLGSIGGGTSLNGTIKRLTYWNTRLPNSTLQRLTA